MRESLIELMTSDQRFAAYISSSTDKADLVRYRADAWLGRLTEIVQRCDEPRRFSLAAKRRLFEHDPTCRICGQQVHDVDDGELDHVEPRWRGGPTIPTNVRLTYRYCNRSRGGG